MPAVAPFIVHNVISYNACHVCMTLMVVLICLYKRESAYNTWCTYVWWDFAMQYTSTNIHSLHHHHHHNNAIDGTCVTSKRRRRFVCFVYRRYIGILHPSMICVYIDMSSRLGWKKNLSKYKYIYWQGERFSIDDLFHHKFAPQLWFSLFYFHRIIWSWWLARRLYFLLNLIDLSTLLVFINQFIKLRFSNRHQIVYIKGKSKKKIFIEMMKWRQIV